MYLYLFSGKRQRAAAILTYSHYTDRGCYRVRGPRIGQQLMVRSASASATT